MFLKSKLNIFWFNKPCYFLCIFTFIFLLFIFLYLLKERHNQNDMFTFEKVFDDFENKSYEIQKDRCQPILMEGRFLDIDPNKCQKKVIKNFRENDFHCIRKWKPDGCNLHYYNIEDYKKCFKSISSERKYLFFIGDSRIRYLYDKIVWSFKNTILLRKFETDHTVMDENTNTVFTYICMTYTEEKFVNKIKSIKEFLPQNATSVVVIGITLHMRAKFHDKIEGLKVFKKYLLEAKENLNAIGERATLLWFLQARKSQRVNAVTRELLKHYPKLLSKQGEEILYGYNNPNEWRRAFIEQMQLYRTLPTQSASIDLYNKMAEFVLNGTSAKMWYSAKHIGENSYEDYMDSTHLADYDNYNLMQIILNMLCNKIMTLSPEYCCT
ncbi:UNVERIFIED_CONTAM: hypothetical protein RMT77_005248 [Armadillidium vulgare]